MATACGELELETSATQQASTQCGSTAHFSDRTALEAAWAKPLTTIDFATRDDGTPISDPPWDVTFAALTLRGVTFRSVHSAWNQFLYSHAGTTIRVEFPAGTHAFGTELATYYGHAGTFTFTLSTGDVYTQDYVHATSGRYFGAVSEDPIEWVEITFPADAFILDNFTFGTSYTRFADAASFATGWGLPTTTIDFSTRDDGSAITDPSDDAFFSALTLRGVTFRSLRSYWNLFIYNASGTTIRMEFPDGTYAFGTELATFYGAAGTFTIRLSTGQVFTQAYVHDTSGRYFGYVGDRAVEWAEITFTGDWFILDNFVFGTKQRRFSDFTSFANAWGDELTTIDFETRDDGTPITDPSDDAYFAALQLRGATIRNVRSYWNLFVYNASATTIRVEPPPETYAVGTNVATFYGVVGTFTITLSTGKTYTLDGNSGYIGLLSDDAIEWMDVTFVGDWFILDNLSFGSRNRAPVLDAIGNRSVAEGSTLSFVASAADCDTVTYGLVGAPAGATLDPATGAFTWQPADGPSSATFTVVATDGALTDQETITVNVANVAPTVVSRYATLTARPGQLVSFYAYFTDPGADTWTCTIDWRDGTVQQITPCVPGPYLSATHAYLFPGSYDVTMTVTDKDNAGHAASTLVSVGPDLPPRARPPVPPRP